MKKIIALAIVTSVFLTLTIPGIQAADKKLYNKAEVKTSQNEGITTGGWILIGVDAALTGLSVFALLDERSAADDYNALFTEINNTTQANFNILDTKKKEIDGKILFAGISSGAAAAAILYTIADVLWLHAAFPAATKISYDPKNKAVKFSVNRGF